MKFLNNLAARFGLNRKMLEQSMALLTASSALAIILYGVMSLQPGWLSWGITVPAHLILLVTALARVKDIKSMSKRYQVRRMGLVMVGAGSLAFMASPFFAGLGAFPTWRTVLLVWGMALAWLTTPDQPPWWRYITGEFRNETNKPV